MQKNGWLYRRVSIKNVVSSLIFLFSGRSEIER